MPWYYAQNNQRLGPVNDAEFARLAREKTIREDTLVWKYGMPDWKTYAEVESTLPPPEIRPATTVEPSADDLRPVASMENINVSAILGERLYYAGFWIRVGAKLIDWVILWGATRVLILSMDLGKLDPMEILQMSPETLYPLFWRVMFFKLVEGAVCLGFYWFFLKKFAATPGKMLFGLQVVSTRGGPLGTGQIVGRYFSEILAKYFTLCIGYIVAGFDPEKRAMHDHFCDTRVVYKRKH